MLEKSVPDNFLWCYGLLLFNIFIFFY